MCVEKNEKELVAEKCNTHTGMCHVDADGFLNHSYII
jgi:hypothetical protein